MPRPGGQGVRDTVVVVGTLLVLGVLAGVLWSVVVTPAEFTKLAKGGAMGEGQLGRQFGADGWYVVIAVLTGLAAGAVLSWWRSRSALVTSAALVVGATVAAIAMALTGHLLGPGDPDAALAAAKIGSQVPEALDVGTRPVWPLTDYLQNTLPFYLAWPVGVLAGALVVLLGRGQEDAEESVSTSRRARSDDSPEVGNSDILPGRPR